MTKTAKASTQILEILQKAVIDAEGIKLPHPLDREIWFKVNKLLELAGAKWNKEARKHLFTKADATQNIQTLMQGEGLVDEKRELQAYYTPRNLADDVARHADLWPGMKVLEPNAGGGALIDAAIRQVPQRFLEVHAIEINPAEADALRDRHPLDMVVNCDFLQFDPAKNGAHYDRIIMNPPFTGDQDIAHVQHAFRFLKEGGRLVSIMSQGFLYDDSEDRKVFRAFLKQYGRVIKHVPSGAFRQSGTMVKTVMIELVKPFSN